MSVIKIQIMLNNGELYKLFCYIANKTSLGGYANPDNFNLSLKTNSIILLRELTGITNDFNFGVPVSRRQKGMSYLLDDKTNKFKKKGNISFSSGIATLPNDYFRFDSLRTTGAQEDVELLFSSEVSHRLSNYIDAPDTEFPACEIIGSSVYIYPPTISSGSLVYYRYPEVAKYDFYIDADGNVQYLEVGQTYTLKANEVGSAGQTSGNVVSTSVELEWDDPEKIDIIWLCLKQLGVNLSRQDLYQISDKIQSEGK